MAATAEDVMNKPWPQRESTLRLNLMPDLPPEEKQRLRSENRCVLEENGRRRREAFNEKRSAYLDH